MKLVAGNRVPVGEWMIEGYSGITGINTVTIQIDDTMAERTYNLSPDAANFPETVTVVNQDEAYYGELTVNGDTLRYDDMTFTLVRDDSGNITLTTAGQNAPSVLSITATPDSLTNQDVTVTAEFSQKTESKWYSWDSENWDTYIETGIVFEDNGTVYFKAEADGKESVRSFTVDWIDKTPPEKPVVTADITEPTDQPVTLTADYSGDSVVREYSPDGQTWQNYTDPIQTSENGVFYFRVFDAAGNESEVTTCEVTNIDKTPPEEPVVTADITEPTTQDVTLTAVYSDDSILRQYSTDGETWQDYAGDILVTENGSHYFRAVDAAGNESEITVYEVTNIDKADPTIESVTGTDIAVNSVLTVRVTAADDLSGVEATYYSLDNSPWKEFTNTFTITRNGTLTLKALDKAGNTMISDGMKITAFDQDALKILRSEAGEFATKQTGDQLRVYSDGTWKLKNIQSGTETELGKLDPQKWETAGSADFDGDGLLEMVMTDKTTGDLYLADDLSGGISEGKLTIKLGTLGPGYSFQGAGRFAGQTGQHDILLQGPAFGDASVSLNYGLPVWVNNTAGKRQYDGWVRW